MAEPVIVIAQSGSGKTSSILPNEILGIKGLNPNETLLISFTSKIVPKQHYVTASDVAQEKYKDRIPNRIVVPAKECILNGKPIAKSDWVIAAIQKYVSKGIFKNIVLDDFQYLSIFPLNARILEKGYDKYSENGKIVLDVFFFLMDLPENIIFYLLVHGETKQDNFVTKTSMKLGGQLVKNSIGDPEGLSNTVLYMDSESVTSESGEESIKKFFITQGTQYNTCKSIAGMFPYRIPNDMSIVENAIREYLANQ